MLSSFGPRDLLSSLSSSEPSLISSSSLLGLARFPPLPRPLPLPLPRPLPRALVAGDGFAGFAIGRLSVPGILRGRPRGRLIGIAEASGTSGGRADADGGRRTLGVLELAWGAYAAGARTVALNGTVTGWRKAVERGAPTGMSDGEASGADALFVCG